MAVPLKPLLGFYEQIKILELAKRYAKTRQIGRSFARAVADYLFHFSGLGVKYGIGELWTEQEALDRIRWLSRRNPSLRLHRLTVVIRRQNRDV